MPVTYQTRPIDVPTPFADESGQLWPNQRQDGDYNLQDDGHTPEFADHLDLGRYEGQQFVDGGGQNYTFHEEQTWQEQEGFTHRHAQNEVNPRSRVNKITDWAYWCAEWVDYYAIGWMSAFYLPIIRIGLGIIFLWFGGLKFFGGVSPAEGLVRSTITEVAALVTTTPIPTTWALLLLALWEVCIGMGLLVNRCRRIFLGMLFLQVPGTILPIFLLPEIVWNTFPHGLTMEGQYIVKNLVLVGAAIALGANIDTDPYGNPYEEYPSEDSTYIDAFYGEDPYADPQYNESQYADPQYDDPQYDDPAFDLDYHDQDAVGTYPP